MKFKNFLFDWDGCLADSLPIWFGAMKQALWHFKIEAPDDVIKQGFCGWDVFQELGVPNMNEFAHKVYEYVTSNLNNIEFNDGVHDILSRMKSEKLKMAIVSSTEKSKIIPVLERLKADDYFECIIGRNDVNNLKPDSEPVLKAIKKIGAEKEATVMIGDSVVDVQAGQNAEIATIWYSSESNQNYHVYAAASNCSPSITINHISDLENMI